jgi:hypothetical protein
MLQIAWEWFVTGFAYAVFFPALYHPIETSLACCGFLIFAIWKAW